MSHASQVNVGSSYADTWSGTARSARLARDADLRVGLAGDLQHVGEPQRRRARVGACSRRRERGGDQRGGAMAPPSVVTMHCSS
jgi:hypothetical protein